MLEYSCARLRTQSSIQSDCARHIVGFRFSCGCGASLAVLPKPKSMPPAPLPAALLAPSRRSDAVLPAPASFWPSVWKTKSHQGKCKATMLLYVTVCQRHCQMPQWYNVALSLSRSLSHHLPIFLISISDHFSLSLVFSLFLSECFCLCLCICLCRCLSPPLSLSLSLHSATLPYAIMVTLAHCYL